MLNLSDKELDRLSREAAQEHDPGDVLGPRSWEKLEPRLDADLGKTGSSPLRGVRRFPFYYAPAAILLVAGVLFFTTRNQRSGHNQPSGGPPTATNPSTQSISIPKNSEHSTNSTPSVSSSTTADSTVVAGPRDAAAGAQTNAASTQAKAAGTPSAKSADPNAAGASTTGTSPAATSATGTSTNAASTSPSSAGSLPANTTAIGNNKTTNNRTFNNSTSNNRTHSRRPNHTKPDKTTGPLTRRGNSTRGGATDGNTNTATTNDNNATAGRNTASNGSTNNGLNSPTTNPAKPTASSPRELTHASLPKPRRLQQRTDISDSALRAYTAKSTIQIGKNKSLRINRRLQFGLSLAPDFSSVNSLAGDKPGSTIGLTLDYQFANRWYLSTGLLLDRKNYAARAQDYHAPYDYYRVNGIHNLDFVKGSLSMLEIPLNLRYDFSVAGNTLFFATAGFSSYFMTNENCNYYFNSFGPREECKSFNYNNNNNFLFSSVNLSLGVETGLSDNFSLLIAPYIKLPSRNIGFGQISMSSVGVNFALKFAPVISKRRK